jgi:hypothetical protein
VFPSKKDLPTSVNGRKERDAREHEIITGLHRSALNLLRRDQTLQKVDWPLIDTTFRFT